MEDKLKITRVRFCQSCHDAGKPNKGNIFITIGRTHGVFQTRLAANWGTRGFTPHIFEIMKIDRKRVYYKCYCAMDECGIDLQWNEKKEKFDVYILGWWESSMPIKDWNALILYKDDPQYSLDQNFDK